MNEEHDVRVLLDRVADRAPRFEAPSVERVVATARRRSWTRRGVVIGAVVLIAIASAGVLVTATTNESSPRVGIAHGSTSGAAALARGAWRDLPAAPLTRRDDSAVVWTGHEMIVWGGGLGLQGAPNDGGTFGDGAAYNPKTDQWRTIATSPLSPRREPLAIWDGKEMIVFGGNYRPSASGSLTDGAAYNPKTDKWRTLAPMPATGVGFSEPSTLWTGHQMIVMAVQFLGATGRAGVSVRSYDPSTDQWRVRESWPSPQATNGIANNPLSAVWADGRAFAWWTDQQANIVTFASYTPKTDTWKTLPTTGMSTYALNYPQPVWTGRDIILPAPIGTTQPDPGSRYSPRTGQWKPFPASPLHTQFSTSNWNEIALIQLTALTGDLADSGRAAAAWDPTVGWQLLPNMPHRLNQPSNVFWTGKELLVWGVLITPDTGPAQDARNGGMRLDRPHAHAATTTTCLAVTTPPGVTAKNVGPHGEPACT